MTVPTWAGLAGDHHVHSTFSFDAESTVVENVTAARQAGLHQIRLVDHVRASSTWVPEFCDQTAALRSTAQDITILTGVEAKMLDATGRLDLPPGMRTGPNRPDRVDRVVIADHQYPSPVGPWTPSRVLEERAAGLSSAAILDTLVGAMIGAMAAVEHAQLAHPFSLLPKMGLSEDDLLAEHLSALCAAASAHGTWVEINEKWACPGHRAIEAFAAAGVTLVASSDSHHCRDVGRYRRVIDLSQCLADAGTDAPLAAGRQ